MDNKLDFRVGDVVCDIRYGNGNVVEINTNSCWPISVDFGNDRTEMYLPDGRESPHDKLRSLYHGTWEQVFGNLPNLKPRRKVKRWVNLYDSGEWKIFNDKDIAESFADTTPFKVISIAVEIEVDE